MKIDGYNFGGFKRRYKESEGELWCAMFLSDEGAIVEDHIVILWEKKIIKVVLLTNSQRRGNSPEYLDLIFGLFHHVAKYIFKVFYQDNPYDYKIEEQIELARNLKWEM